MPTPECWQDIGRNFGILSAQITDLKETAEEIKKQFQTDHAELKKDIVSVNNKVDSIEKDRVAERARLTTMGTIMAIVLPGIGVVFSEPLKRFGQNLFR